MTTITRTLLAGMIDHTLLAADATALQIECHCAEAMTYGIGAVYVHSSRVALAATLLRGTPVLVCSVAGFPLGANLTRVKAYEAACAVEAGARSIDMVLNIGAMKDADYALVEEDVRQVVQRVGSIATVKVILETCLLTTDEIGHACRLCEAAGANFVKTSTGLSKAGATEEHVRLLRTSVSLMIGVKAAGGIRDYATACRMIHAGATRVGTSASLAILSAAPE